MSEKDKQKANNHRTSRSKLTDMESYIMKQFFRRCLYESNFPTKGDAHHQGITWQYARRWLYRNGFSYKAIHKRSPGQMLTIGKVEV